MGSGLGKSDGIDETTGIADILEKKFPCVNKCFLN